LTYTSTGRAARGQHLRSNQQRGRSRHQSAGASGDVWSCDIGTELYKAGGKEAASGQQVAGQQATACDV
jgi:hypothetical protein